MISITLFVGMLCLITSTILKERLKHMHRDQEHDDTVQKVFGMVGLGLTLSAVLLLII